MDALPRRLRVRRSLPPLLVGIALVIPDLAFARDAARPLEADADASASPPHAVVAAPPIFPIFSIDRRFDRVLRPVLEAAARKLADGRCQAILSDFTDPAGRTLGTNLAATGQSLPDYLGYVVFSDGRDTRPCSDRQVMAWTTPGSRAVRLCSEQFGPVARSHRGDAANLLIHETLHTLGLTEGPPDSREITARVAQRCGH